MNEQLKQIAHNNEAAAPNEQQKVFYEHWKQEAARATQAEKVANQQARDRMKGLTAPELRKIGAKQLLWGWGLSFINGVGAFVGWAGGGLGGHAIGTALGMSAIGAGAMSMGLGVVGVVGGAVAGSELVGYIYDKLANKFDNTLPKLEKEDKLLGGIFAMAGWTPPMVAGARNVFEGYNQMRSIQ
ncbi:hypothetical protein KBC80_04170 [Candidatus Woesebacteria bacterium]|nr:hypothetical protein [Candidatus Woesebacteria bacterium]